MRKTLLLTVATACGSHAAAPSAPMPASAPTQASAPRAPAPAAPAKDYPPTRRDDVVDTLHGVAVADPYRWLEDASKPDVQAWMKAQDAYTRAHLATIPGRDALAARLAEVFYYDSVTAPVHRGQRFFYARKHKDKEKAIVYWKDGERGAEHVLLDPNGWSADGSSGLKNWQPSWDGKYLAYNRAEHNADETTMYVVDVASGKLLKDALPGTKYSGASWTPDSRGFYYVFVPPPSDAISIADRPGFAELRYHALGSDPAKDPTVHEKTGDPRTFLNGDLSLDGHWLFAKVSHGWAADDLYVKDLRAHQKDWTPIIEGVPANFSLEAWKDTFYVTTNDGAPRYHVYAVDPKKLARKDWKEIVPARADTLESSTIVGGRLLLQYLHDATAQVEVHGLDGALVRAVAIPPLGTISEVDGRADDDTAYLTYTSFTAPQVVYKTSMRTSAVDEWARVTVPVDTANMVAEQVRYPSKDGTEITMFLIHRKDAVKDGKTPTYLTGYGGFDLNVTPGFVSSRSSWAAHAVWLEHGGMVAIPNLRGGGEYGEDWHEAGMLLQKQHVFDDFLAAARWLEASGWTSPEHLAISGGSNGGLLMGAALTQGPALFKAAIVEVPLLDMVRYHLSGSGKTWIGEYGSAEDPAQFKAIYAYSPYHHVKEGERYPAVLVSSSDHDDRVDPMHARKFAALLQWAQGADAPVWLRIQQNAGHSGADVVKQKVEQNADTYAFLMWQLGMK